MTRLNNTTYLMILCALCSARVVCAAEPLPTEVINAVKSLRTVKDAARADAYQKILTLGDGRLVPLLQAYQAGLLEEREGKLVIYQARIDLPDGNKAYPLADAFTLESILDTSGKPMLVAELGADMWKAPRSERKQLSDLISFLSLADPDPVKRQQAIHDAGDRADVASLPALKLQLERDPNGQFAAILKEAIAKIELTHGDRAAKLAAVEHLGELASSRGSAPLSKALAAAAEAKDEELVAAIEQANESIESHQTVVRWVQYGFAGLSLGSIFILMALGLSIIFGTMNVINMAHGEFMMVGAFTALYVCEFFKKNLPGFFDYYFIVALPAAFLVAGIVGMVCERLVIRRLYGRPLETLLATSGISLILIQSARTQFGDTNSLTPPGWLQGGLEVTTDLVLPLNRLFIIAFCVVCIAIVWFIVEKTKLGLLLRATTQNRPMAASLGVATRKIDSLTFGIGAGLAGLAGVAVPLFDKINPQMGQGYIVDSFMVVVVGGVGKLMGTIIAGLGLGFITKFVEPMISGTGSVIYTKIIVLALIIAILQKRPSGLFPARGRLADA